MTTEEIQAELYKARINGLCAAGRGPHGGVRKRCNVYLLSHIHPQLSFDAQLAAAWETGYEEGIEGRESQDAAMKSAIETAERRGFAEARRGKDFSAWDYVEELKAAMGWSEVHIHPQEEPLSAAFDRGYHIGKLTLADYQLGLNPWLACIIGGGIGLLVRFLF